MKERGKTFPTIQPLQRLSKNGEIILPYVPPLDTVMQQPVEFVQQNRTYTVVESGVDDSKVETTKIALVRNTDFSVFPKGDAQPIGTLRGAMTDGAERVFFTHDVIDHRETRSTDDCKDAIVDIKYPEVMGQTIAHLVNNEIVDTFLSQPDEDPAIHTYLKETANDHGVIVESIGGEGTIVTKNFVKGTVLPPHTERADLSIETVPLQKPTEPTIFYVGKATEMADSIHVDGDMVVEELKRTGFSDKQANGVAIAFHDKGELREKNSIPIVGWHVRDGGVSASEDEQTFYPLFVNVAITGNEKYDNNTLWHEMGHGKRHHIDGEERTALYNDEQNIKNIEKGGIAVSTTGGGLFTTSAILETADVWTYTGGMIGTAGGILLGAAGLAMYNAPYAALWQVEPEEIYARWFAYKRRHLHPIRYDQE